MNDGMTTQIQTFKTFLGSAFDQGIYTTDDVIAFVMPLFKEVLSFHEADLVGPFEKQETLFITNNRLDIDEHYAHRPKQHATALKALFAINHADHFNITENLKLETEIGEGAQSVHNMAIHLNTNEPLPQPAYVPGYICFEQLIGHHDAQTDIFCLGLVLGSMAMGLDLYDHDDLKAFVDHRNNPVRYNNSIHPTICALIAEMTALDRSKRIQDLYEVIERLEHYRDFDPEKQTDLSTVAGWVNKPITDRNELVLNKLKNRLFDTSRRNRLLYYKPNMRFMNLTVSSVPMVLHYQSIRPELLFTWNEEIAGKVKGMKDIILNKYLRFDDHQYVSSTLDKIRVEAQRDIHEYGFSQLKLVITFLNWHNLKEDQNERIQSPLLLIPVELKRNKKLKEDHYVLKILDNAAEVNPVLSNYLRELYGIKLPDFIDLDDITLEEFYKVLKEQIDGANQGITLNYIDKPRIKLIHSVARQTVGNYKKRLKRTGNTLESYKNINYSYQHDSFKPLGLEIFRQRIEPRATFMEFLINDDITITHHQLTGTTATKERQLFEIADSERNPFSWDFDLCNVVLGNFNYKKMSLVRDYNHVIDQKVNHPVFENLFSNLPKQRLATPENLDVMEEWNHVITADPTQTKAVLKSRTGESYIIQGPPGTGKSQTITNLIADFVARGKSVLFVCEKRAALDVVYHRLKQQDLDKLCCYIHDSQGDKREFIRDLKTSYEEFITKRESLDTIKGRRRDLLKKMEEALEVIRHFHLTNVTSNDWAGLPVRKLLERLVELRNEIVAIEKTELGNIPHYKDWLQYGEIVGMLNTALVEAGVDGSFAEHPFCKLKEGCFIVENPYKTIHTLISQSKEQLLDIRHTLLENADPAYNPELSRLKKQVAYAVMLAPLVQNNNLELIDSEHVRAKQFVQCLRRYREAEELFNKKESENVNWISKFSLQDTANALLIAQQYEKSFFGFLNRSWRNLKRQLKSKYDFKKHAVAPSCASILENLKAEYDAIDQMQLVKREVEQQFSVSDIENLSDSIDHIRKTKDDPELSFFLRHSQPASGIKSFVALQPVVAKFNDSISACLHSFENKSLETLSDEIDSIAMNIESLDDLLPALKAYVNLPENFKQLLRTMTVSTQQTEATIASKTLGVIYTENKKFRDTDNATIENAVSFIKQGYKQLLKLNAACIIASIRSRFQKHLELSSMALSQLNNEQRSFKKAYNEGRKILENEFGKSMRYKSIRELSGKESGLVLKDIKPVWLMSPLSVSDSLPLDKQYFDAIIFDEASQITLEEGIPSLYRAPQTIIVGDEKQMPPTNFFTAKAEDPDDLDGFNEDDAEVLSNDADSLLVQGARKLSSVMLGWHYRSRYETLISYSNHAFYDAALLTIPDKTIHHTAKAPIEVLQPVDGAKYFSCLFDRSISFHQLPNSVYEKRINLDEAHYIANLVKTLLEKEVPESIGIVAFSQEQQHAIEDALVQLAATDKKFEQQLEEAYNRTEEDQFIGLFVKNLENVQGDERDIIIMSVCYGFDSRKRMIMNFGPINKKGGEKRLNVIFSRAKKHMAIVSSIRHHHITNEYNEGANYFKRFLHYAELISEGNTGTARTILDGLVVNKKDKIEVDDSHVVIQQIQVALRKEGYEVDAAVGQSNFKSSLAVKAESTDEEYLLSILVDDDSHYSNANLLEQYYQRPAILQAFGWRVVHVFSKDWLDNPTKVLRTILKKIKERPVDIAEPETPDVDTAALPSEPDAETSSNPESTPLAVTKDQISFERLVFTDANSNKFWEAALDGHKLIVRFGRIDTKGQTQIKSFPSLELAEKEKEKMIREKLGKGYTRV